jgi:hypothetical protein
MGEEISLNRETGKKLSYAKGELFLVACQICQVEDKCFFKKKNEKNLNLPIFTLWNHR